MSSSSSARRIAMPQWWTHTLAQTAQTAASTALPNEVCGLVYQVEDTDVRLHCFGGFTAPDTCIADPQQVVSFTYELQQVGGNIAATFHTHPNGSSHLSERDTMLADWASVHLLLYLTQAGWQTVCWSMGADLPTL